LTILNVAIQDEDRIAVLGPHGLLPGCQMNDLELDGLPRDILGFIDILLIGTTMNDRPGSTPPSRWLNPAMPHESCCSFHNSENQDQTESPPTSKEAIWLRMDRINSESC